MASFIRISSLALILSLLPASSLLALARAPSASHSLQPLPEHARPNISGNVGSGEGVTIADSPEDTAKSGPPQDITAAETGVEPQADAVPTPASGGFPWWIVGLLAAALTALTARKILLAPRDS